MIKTSGLKLFIMHLKANKFVQQGFFFFIILLHLRWKLDQNVHISTIMFNDHVHQLAKLMLPSALCSHGTCVFVSHHMIGSRPLKFHNSLQV